MDFPPPNDIFFLVLAGFGTAVVSAFSACSGFVAGSLFGTAVSAFTLLSPLLTAGVLLSSEGGDFLRKEDNLLVFTATGAAGVGSGVEGSATVGSATVGSSLGASSTLGASTTSALGAAASGAAALDSSLGATALGASFFGSAAFGAVAFGAAATGAAAAAAAAAGAAPPFLSLPRDACLNLSSPP